MKEQKMKESPELEELFRGRNNVKCTDNDLRSVIGERLKEGNKITNKKKIFLRNRQCRQSRICNSFSY